MKQSQKIVQFLLAENFNTKKVSEKEYLTELFDLFTEQVEDCRWAYFNYIAKNYQAELKKYQVAVKANKTNIAKAEADAPALPNIADLKIVSRRMMDNPIDAAYFKALKSGKLIDKFFSDLTEEGGLVTGIYVAIGDPGVGKTTLLAQLCLDIEKNLFMEYLNENPKIKKQYEDGSDKVKKEIEKAFPAQHLFANSEMAEEDFQFEALKAEILNRLNMMFFTDYPQYNPLEVFAKFLEENQYRVVVLDSLKDTLDRIKVYNENNGIKKSDKTIESEIINLLKHYNKTKGITFILIQQINKGGEYVGSKSIEHNTTGLFEMRHCSSGRRYIKFEKNRRNGNLIKTALYYFKDKVTGEIQFDEKDFERRMQARQTADENKKSLEEMENNFESLLEEGGVKIDLAKIGTIVARDGVAVGTETAE